MRKLMWVFLLCLTAAFFLTGEKALGQQSAFRTFIKGMDYDLEDTVLRGVESNVLFFVDTSSLMAMSMRGQVPVFRYVTRPSLPDDAWMRANYPMMRSARYRSELFREHTYGSGSRSVSEGTFAQQEARLNNNRDGTGNLRLPFVSPHTGMERWNVATPSTISIPGRLIQWQEDFHPLFNLSFQDWRAWSRWGRDVNYSNNIIGHPDHYYTPYSGKPYFLTFRDPNWANWNGLGNPPNDIYGQPMPAALRNHLPARDQHGNVIQFRAPVPLDLANRFLVPNDSKIYQLKLVLWRILYPEP